MPLLPASDPRPVHFVGIAGAGMSALAELFGTATRPTHRAFADAQATVEVLHHLLERIGNLGVQSLEELLTLVRDSAPHRPTPTPPRRRSSRRSGAAWPAPRR